MNATIDRIEFTKSIHCDNFQQTVTTFFDQIMALYNIVGGFNVSICGIMDGGNLHFKLTFSNHDELYEMKSAIENKAITVYGKMYNINCNIDGTYLNICIINRVSG